MMSINDFFIDTLGANVKNARWSWGAVDPMTHRIFLRVWEDQIDGERKRIGSDVPRNDSHGFAERNEHLAQMQNGAEAFGVVCRRTKVPVTTEVSVIASFDSTSLLQLGALIKDNGGTYARIVGRVSVEQVSGRQRTAYSTLTEDLKSIQRQKIEATTKEALVNARVGQGLFRSQVLQLWGHCCAVTHSVTLDAIRASHIKPWRSSTDDERLDPNNGIPLVASLDALFDAGLISFESSGRMIVSSKLSTAERQIFGIVEEAMTKNPTEKAAEYLAYHRNDVFHK